MLWYNDKSLGGRRMESRIDRIKKQLHSASYKLTPQPLTNGEAIEVPSIAVEPSRLPSIISSLRGIVL